MIRDKEVTLEYVPGPDFWYCKRVSIKYLFLKSRYPSLQLLHVSSSGVATQDELGAMVMSPIPASQLLHVAIV